MYSTNQNSINADCRQYLKARIRCAQNKVPQMLIISILNENITIKITNRSGGGEGERVQRNWPQSRSNINKKFDQGPLCRKFIKILIQKFLLLFRLTDVGELPPPPPTCFWARITQKVAGSNFARANKKYFTLQNGLIGHYLQ